MEDKKLTVIKAVQNETNLIIQLQDNTWITIKELALAAGAKSYVQVSNYHKTSWQLWGYHFFTNECVPSDKLPSQLSEVAHTIQDLEVFVVLNRYHACSLIGYNDYEKNRDKMSISSLREL